MSEKATALIGDKQIIIETGKLAKQADGAVTVQLGETIVLVAAVAAWVLGAAWYMALSKPWLAALGKTEADMKGADGKPKGKCMMGDNADCDKCGCVVPFYMATMNSPALLLKEAAKRAIGRS